MLRAALLGLALLWPVAAQQEILIIADEVPAMEVLGRQIRAGAGFASGIVKQGELPADLAAYAAVIVYIHRNITPETESACIRYANSGGKLLLIHHSISSGKRVNKDWLPFLGVALPEGELSQGGYKWIDPAEWSIVNLAPGSFVTSHDVPYDAKVAYGGRERDAFTLHNSEIYLNHVFTGPHVVLLGLRYRDPHTGVVYTQDRAGWYKQAGKGWVFYFMPGHNAAEFDNPAYARILINALQWRP